MRISEKYRNNTSDNLLTSRRTDGGKKKAWVLLAVRVSSSIEKKNGGKSVFACVQHHVVFVFFMYRYWRHIFLQGWCVHICKGSYFVCVLSVKSKCTSRETLKSTVNYLTEREFY